MKAAWTPENSSIFKIIVVTVFATEKISLIIKQKDFRIIYSLHAPLPSKDGPSRLGSPTRQGSGRGAMPVARASCSPWTSWTSRARSAARPSTRRSTSSTTWWRSERCGMGCGVTVWMRHLKLKFGPSWHFHKEEKENSTWDDRYDQIEQVMTVAPGTLDKM